MKKSITAKGKDLKIKISETESNHDHLLSNLQLCQQGKCDCPTDEYSKLDKLDIKSSETEIVINLKPKSGQEFDKDEIKRCINFVIDKVEEK